LLNKLLSVMWNSILHKLNKVEKKRMKEKTSWRFTNHALTTYLLTNTEK